MKKLLFFCIFIAVAMNMNSQTEDFICATPDNTTPDPAGAFSYSIDTTVLSNFDPVVFNVFFWGINEDDGTSTNKLTQTMALKAIAELNIKYNDANIFFKYYGYDYIDSSQFYTIYASCDGDPNSPCFGSTLYVDFPTFINDNPQYNSANAIDFYIPRHTDGFAGYGSSNYLYTVINAGSFEGSPRVTNHEMGHVFGLIHTHAGWTSSNYCEHVTRDKYLPNGDLNPDFNADSAGDWVVDTAAVPDFRNEKCEELGYPYPYTGCPEAYKNAYIDEGTCTYFGDGDDCLVPVAVPYDIYTEDVRNLMAYTHATCGLDLTTGQNIRMRDRIENSIVHYQPVMNTVPSLYEPYSGEYINGFTITDTQPRFQPGFDYKYLTCYPDGGYPQPSDYYDTSFSYMEYVWWYGFYKDIEPQYYNTIIHKNGYAIRIEQLEQQPRKCWNNGIAIGGTVIQFNDEVFNSNVTITSQDSTAINDTELIEDLQPGLYNVIKNYQDGRTEESVIFKENN